MGSCFHSGRLVVITGLLIWGDSLKGQGTEAFYWLAIIFLRAGATNVGDGLIHIFGLSFIVASLLTGVATLVAGFFTLPPFAGAISPLIDLRYWLAMGIGGVFGTVFGDLTSHTIGMFPALITLGVGLIVVILVRGALAPTSMLGYWCIVLAERAAGTPAGDWFASRTGARVGPPSRASMRRRGTNSGPVALSANQETTLRPLVPLGFAGLYSGLACEVRGPDRSWSVGSA